MNTSGLLQSKWSQLLPEYYKKNKCIIYNDILL